MPDMWGPFETGQEAHDAAVRHIEPEPGWSILRAPQNRQMLADACEAAGVVLGDYDARILDWMAGWEDGICAVLAGLIRRAAASSGEG
jgi:hypothetical protein